MSDRVIFGHFSEANPDFIFSRDVDALKKFKTENKEFEGVGHVEFSASTRKHVGQLTLQRFGYDAMEKLRIDHFRNFYDSTIVRLKGHEAVFNDMTLFHSVTEIPDVEHEHLEKMKVEVGAFHKAAMEALFTHGDKACFIIF